MDMELVTEYDVKGTQLLVCFCNCSGFNRSSRNEILIICKTTRLQPTL